MAIPYNVSAGLAVSDVVNVAMNIAPIAAGYQNFGSMLIIGSSAVVDTFERVRQYANILQVGEDFGNTTPEFLAAELFFDQNPQPAILYIGRWAQTASSGVLHGDTMGASEWVALENGFSTMPTNSAFFIEIDGKPVSASGMNFTADLNMNAAAGTIQTALGGTATVVWNAQYTRFDITSATTGVNSSVSYGAPPTAWNYIAFTGAPSNNDTISINIGTSPNQVLTFTSGTPANANQIQIVAGNLAQTMINAAAVINASNAANIALVNAQIVGDNLYLIADASGTGGNSYTLAVSSPGGSYTAHSASFSGGSGTDISTLFGLTAASGAEPPVAGVAAESALSAVQANYDASGAWYGVAFASSPMPQDSDYLAIAAYLESTQRAHIFAVTTQNSLCLDPDYSLDIGAELQALGYSRSFVQYSSANPYAAVSAFGRAFTVDFDGFNTTITLKFKQEPGVTYEILTETQAAALVNKNINVFVLFNNNTSILKEGVMAGGWFFDERHGLDWLQNRLQTDVWNLLYTSTTKIPQTDDGTHQIVTVLDGGCQQAVRNGMFAPGTWTSSSVGNIKNGQTLPAGYIIYAPLVATQSQADRENRKSVPIQIFGKFAGAIHFVDVAVTVNR